MTYRYTRADRALWRRTHDAVVLLPLGDAEPVTISEPAARLWDALAEPTSLDEALAAVRLANTSEQPTREDLEDLLADLARRRLVTIGEAA
jgi:hypothetical protein